MFSAVDIITDLSKTCTDQIDDQFLNICEKLFSNAILLRKNSFSNLVEQVVTSNQNIMIVHVTPFLDQIKKSKNIYVSHGGLGPVLYGIPTYQDQNYHHLLDYLLDYETQYFNQNESQIIGIKFELKTKEIHYPNYLMFGDLYEKIYNENSDLRKKDVIKNNWLNSENINLFFKFSNEIFSLKNNDLFLDKIDHYINQYIFMRPFYFEALIFACLMLQDDKTVVQYLKKNEIYNNHVKNMIFDLCPNLRIGFSTNKFNPSMHHVIKYLKFKLDHQNAFIINFDQNIFVETFKLYFFKIIFLDLFEKQTVVKNETSFLIGLIKYRLSSKKRWIEELFCEKYNEKLKNNICLSTYKYSYRGEVGMNIKHINRYSIYELKRNLKKETLEIIDELYDVELVSSLIHEKFSLMREPSRNE